MYTQGKFKDGTKGWKVNKLGQHWNNKDLEHLEIVWSDDDECVCDTVYSEADAKLISAAPEMFNALKDLYDDREVWSELFESQQEFICRVLNKATGSDFFKH
jgi:hypothetical protein